MKPSVPAFLPIDSANLDRSANPAEDFYQFANGGWMKNHPLRDEFSRYGTFDQLHEENEQVIKNLLEELAERRLSSTGIEKKIGDFYFAGMNTEAVNLEGLKPLKPYLDVIRDSQNNESVQEIIALFHTRFIGSLFGFYAAPDYGNSNMNIAQLSQGGIGLPDRDYYLDDTPRAAEIRNAYQGHIGKIFLLAGFDNAHDTAPAAIMEFETRLARASMKREELRDPYATYHKSDIHSLRELAPAFDWDRYFNHIGLKEPGEININQPEFLREVNSMLKDVPIDRWKLYLTWCILNASAPFLGDTFVDQDFAFYGSFMSGKKQIKPRWKRIVSMSDSIMGEAIGQIYVKRYFPPEAKARMLKLVNHLKEALRQRIMQLEWMGADTRQKALEKLERITVKIGYPDKWRDFDALEVTDASYFQNIVKGSAFAFSYMLNKVNKPVDPSEWEMTPQTVNAYYNPFQNEIVFPAGILQPPFFFREGDDAVNYGAIGVVIGHEMTHGFDDQGRKFDANGNLYEWWTEEDAKQFNARAEILVKQFDAMEVLKGVHANGRLTLGENIADLGGLHIAYTALKMAKTGKDENLIHGFTEDQRFFLAYAHVWAQNIREQELQRRVKEDEHSPGNLRVNGPLRNIPEFHEAFSVKPGNQMYLPGSERARIW